MTERRRDEISMLPLASFKVKEGFLEVTFILEKKRKGNIAGRFTQSDS